MDSVIPSLRISPNGNTASSFTVAIRGDGPSDTVQPLRETPVGIYINGIYLGRAQGLNMEVADLEQIEVLRGPQGTLFGRNSTSGAISLTTKKPSGEFGLAQTLGAGNYDAFRSVTRVDIPSIAGIKSKVNYLHSERDGWVENRASGQADYSEYKKKGGDFSLNWDVLEDLIVDYRYDWADIDTTQHYFQLYDGNLGQVGVLEKDRQSKTRFPLPLTPTNLESSGHSLIASWQISDSLTLKSLTGYREIDEDGSLNYGGVISSGGIILEEDIVQDQLSQEFQFVGNYKDIEWVAGVFYFEEDADYELNILFSLTPTNQTLLPPVSNPAAAPPTFVTGDSKSMAAYAQATFPIIDRLDLTLGARYTNDEKTAIRNGLKSPDIDSDNVDTTLSLSYQWTESLLSYVKWSTAYKAGGYNVRSLTFQPYEEETNDTFELGLKSDWFDQRLRLNMAVFHSEFQDKQFDFADAVVTIAVDTLNAVKEVELSGFEVEVVAAPTEGLRIGANYTYLDGDMPEQPNPKFPGVFESFEFIQTPQHAGAMTVDYTISAGDIGTLSAHLDITSVSRYAHSTVPIDHQDAYELINARLNLQDIAFVKVGKLSLSLWGKNLADEEYAALRFNQSATGSVIQAFGTPRTYGLELKLEY